MGYSLYSTDVTIKAARVPDAPSGVQTVSVYNIDLVNTDITISWVTPYDGGADIIHFKVMIQTSDASIFAETTAYCDGTDPTIMADTSCTVPVSVLKAAPYSLPWGAHIWVKVLANNIVGDGPYSALGNGGQILTVPSAP